MKVDNKKELTRLRPNKLQHSPRLIIHLPLPLIIHKSQPLDRPRLPRKRLPSNKQHPGAPRHLHPAVEVEPVPRARVDGCAGHRRTAQDVERAEIRHCVFGGGGAAVGAFRAGRVGGGCGGGGRGAGLGNGRRARARGEEAALGEGCRERGWSCGVVRWVARAWAWAEEVA